MVVFVVVIGNNSSTLVMPSSVSQRQKSAEGLRVFLKLVMRYDCCSGGEVLS